MVYYRFDSIEDFMKFDESTNELLEFIDGKVYSLNNNSNSRMLTSSSPKHQLISSNLHIEFVNFLKKSNTKCRAYYAPTDLKLGDNKLIPDLMIICDKTKHNYFETVPFLIVEILYPNNVSHDTIFKKKLYEKYGVKEYWIVNPIDETNSVEVNCLENGKYKSFHFYIGDIIASKVFHGLAVKVEDIFREDY